MDADQPTAGAAPEALTPPGPSQDQSAAAIDPALLFRVKWLAALGALVAGLIAFGLDKATAELIPGETVHLNVMGHGSTAVSRNTPGVIKKSEALASGLLGACLCGFLGKAGGLARRSTPAAILWGLLGAVLGLVLGAGLSFVVFPAFFWARAHDLEQEIILSLGLHGLIWSPLGAAAGLLLAFGLGRPRHCGRTLVAGLMGALLGAVAYDLIMALLFPLARTADPTVETWITLLTSRLLVSLGTALLVILILPGPASDRRTVPGQPLLQSP